LRKVLGDMMARRTATNAADRVQHAPNPPDRVKLKGSDRIVGVWISDANELRALFQLHFGGAQAVGWLPMKEVKQLPANERRAALMTELGRVKGERRRMIF
jgi:hypothetical protein